jgi:hypothetical protein
MSHSLSRADAAAPGLGSAFLCGLALAEVVLWYTVKVWKSDAPVRVRLGVVMLASILVNPHVIVYDVTLLALPLLWFGAYMLERSAGRRRRPSACWSMAVRSAVHANRRSYRRSGIGASHDGSARVDDPRGDTEHEDAIVANRLLQASPLSSLTLSNSQAAASDGVGKICSAISQLQGNRPACAPRSILTGGDEPLAPEVHPLETAHDDIELTVVMPCLNEGGHAGDLHSQGSDRHGGSQHRRRGGGRRQRQLGRLGRDRAIRGGESRARGRQGLRGCAHGRHSVGSRALRDHGGRDDSYDFGELPKVRSGSSERRRSSAEVPA